MKQRWTLNIEGFGKIKHASIEIAPLMLFVGENNTGKSYVMSLLWGILSLKKTLFRNSTTLESYTKCDKWFQDVVSKGEKIEIDETIQQLFIDWFNDLLKLNKDSLVSSIFNDTVKIKNLYISDYKRNGSYYLVRHTKNKIDSTDSEQDVFIIGYIGKIPLEKRAETLGNICWDLIEGDLSLTNRTPTKVGGPIYFPASRTGFMIAYKTLYGYAIENTFDINVHEEDFDEGSYESTFTKPVIRFLQGLSQVKFPKENKYNEIVDFLEKEVIHGEILIDDAPLPNYFYKPEGSSKELSPHVTSSLVTELMPIIASLKSQLKYELIMLEEVESHLHLELQMKMANAIVRLVNAELPVWLTTHSDTMFQQFNNLIKLYNHPKREEMSQKYGYVESEWLNPQDAKAYQFTVDDERKTEVKALKLTEYGFAVPTFNKPIEEQAKQTLELRERDDDDE